jgi:hypothetical protein
MARGTGVVAEMPRTGKKSLQHWKVHSITTFNCHQIRGPPPNELPYFLFRGVRLESTSVLQPLFGPLYQPRIIDDDCGAIGGMRIGRGNRSTQEKIFLQCHFVHHKSHVTWRGLEHRDAAVGSRRLTAWAITRPESRYICLFHVF